MSAAFVAVFALSLSGPQAFPSTVDTTRLRPLFDAIRFVESGNRPNPPDGDSGRSIGPCQIMEAYHKDGCGCGDYQACRQRAHAEATMIGYWRRYCPRALARGDWETLTRVHNGGPRGHRKAATRAYWHKVRKAIKGVAK
jgi:hypothetical protein